MGKHNSRATSRASNVKQKAAPNAEPKAVLPKPEEPSLKSAFRKPGSTPRGKIIFNPQITTDDNGIFLLENISSVIG